MNAKNAAVIAALFLAFGIVGTLDMQDQIASEAEDRLTRENIALRAKLACAKAQSCADIPESFRTVARK